MNERQKVFGHGFREGLLSAISAGFFFVLIGTLFIITPVLFDKILVFFSNFGIVQVPSTPIFLPAPISPNIHSVVYLAVTRFSFVWGLFQIFLLVLRFIIGSPLSKKAETASDIVFWFGASYLIGSFLNETTTVTTWFAFWSFIIVLLGMSLIIRAIILMLRR